MAARARGPLRATLQEHNDSMTEGPAGYVLTCGQCGTTWSVTPPAPGGRLPVGYWKCHNGCNVVATQAKRPAEPPSAAILDLDSLPAILNVPEAAALLRVNVGTVREWARSGDLPGGFKLGKEWRVDRDALLAYIRERGGKP